MPESRYIIGIDLGTTNSAVAFSQPEESADPLEPAPVRTFAIEQLVNPGETREQSLLPSFAFLSSEADFPPGALKLPWDAEENRVAVGELARKRGVENASRLVSSAKSWLAWAGVDRTSALLPVGAPEGVPQVSPMEASRRYLEHLRRAWENRNPEAPFSHQQVLITVPASFDAVARELTAEAATEAGYPNVVLLEEPQAAFYAWIHDHPNWREEIKVGDLILVVDVGGGTTDFSLIGVRERDGELVLERLAVGDHLLLGGDNMDLALARLVERQLQERKVRLDTWQLHTLWQNCRQAKENLLQEGATADQAPLTVLGKGTQLVGGTIKTQLQRQDLERVLLDGFFPRVASADMPERRRAAGLQEIGLPYVADAAITKHLARFLRQEQLASEETPDLRGPSGLVCPTHILFNGGVMLPALLRNRVVEVLNGWLAEEQRAPVECLTAEDPMRAVARGAVCYGMAKQGRGIRIRGGVPRTYYVGVEAAMPSVPGFPAPIRALTVAPYGMEEGTSVDIPGREFRLVVGEPADFRFFSSAERKNDAPGTLLEDPGNELEELSPIEVTLDSADGEGQVVRVTLESRVTETGQLQLWCVSRSGKRWKLEFNVRQRVTE
jgi:hypothetical protein